MHRANQRSRDSSPGCPSSRCSLPMHKKQHPFSTPRHSCSPQSCSASTWLSAAWEPPPPFCPLSQLYHQRGGQILPLRQQLAAGEARRERGGEAGMNEPLGPLGAGHFPKLTCSCKRILQLCWPSCSAGSAGSCSECWQVRRECGGHLA